MDQGGDIKTKVGDKQYSSVVLFKEGFTAGEQYRLTRGKSFKL